MLSCWLCQGSGSDSEEDGPGVKKLADEDWRIKKGALKKGGHTQAQKAQAQKGQKGQGIATRASGII